MKRLLVAAVLAASVLALTACEDTEGTTEDDGVHGVIFVPMQGNPAGIPIFY